MGERIKILIVDDSAAVRDTLLRLLGDLRDGLQVEFIQADTGPRALEIIERENLDVIILDLHLPDLTGTEVLTKAAAVKLELAPVIILTGYPDVETALLAGKMNVFDYMSKRELSSDRLRKLVLDAVSQKSASLRKTLTDAALKFFNHAGFKVRAGDDNLAVSNHASPEWKGFGQIAVSCSERGRLTREDVAAAERWALELSPGGGLAFVIHSEEMRPGAPDRVWRARKKGVFVVPLYYPKMRQVMEAGDAEDCYRHLVDLKRSWCIMTDPYESLDATSDPQWFVGKQDLIEQILNHLRGSDRHVVLYGMRKTGKTALLNQVELGCRAMGFPTARWIAMKGVGFETVLYNFIADLTASAGQMYEGAALPTPGALPEYLKNPTAQFKGDLHRLWAALGRHSGERVKLVLLIDEVDINNFFPWEGDREEHYQRYCDLFQTLKEVTETLGEKPLNLIAAGEHYWIDEVQRFPYNEQFQNPMYRRFLRMPLTFLTRRENAELVGLLGELAGLEYTAAGLERIYDETQGHPQITRWLCSCIWRMRETGRFDGDVKADTIAGAVNFFLHEKAGEAYRNYFEQVFWWDPLSPDTDSDQQVLAEIALHGACATDELFERLCGWDGRPAGGLERDDAAASVRRLTELNIIEEVPARRAHRVTVPLYRRWIRIEKLGLA